MANLIGREKEIATLEHYENSGKAEFVALYGRRRVGKTFLVQQHYKNRFSFAVTGSLEGTAKEQMYYFTSALHEYGLADAAPTSWPEAFECLRKLLETKATDKRMIVFIDELPCFDTVRSGFISALSHFWNVWGVNQDHLMLIVCGSATSWMVHNILDNHGGLHNRVTHEMHLHAFSLRQTEQFLLLNGMEWDRLTIVQTYMALGGIPYYLSLLDSRLSLAQNIDALFFCQGGELRREYTRLYRSLFRNPEPYMQIVSLLASHREGLTRTQIADHLKVMSGGKLTSMLDDLRYCDFVVRCPVHGRKLKATDGLYRLADFFSLFYLKFATRTDDEHYWSNQLLSPALNTWYGLAFERVCMAHIPQIKAALGIDRIQTEYYAWRSKADSAQQAQIDLLIERADRIINLCEIKYSSGYYMLTKDEHDNILRRMSAFRDETACRKGICPTLITTYGLTPGRHASAITATVTLDALFEE